MDTAPPAVIEGATILDAFRANVRKIPGRPAMRRRTPTGWEIVTWADYGEAVAEVTAGLADLGIGPGERVAILSGNRVEWHLADLGALANGGVTVPVYPTSSAAQVGYILGHCEARLCFVEDSELLAKVLEVRDTLPKLDRVVIFDDGDRLDDPFLVSFSELRTVGSRPPATGAATSRGASLGHRARAGRHLRLHQRYHRSSQGGDTDARQHHVDDPQRRLTGPSGRGRAIPVVPAPQPRGRAAA